MRNPLREITLLGAHPLPAALAALLAAMTAAGSGWLVSGPLLASVLGALGALLGAWAGASLAATATLRYAFAPVRASERP